MLLPVRASQPALPPECGWSQVLKGWLVGLPRCHLQRTMLMLLQVPACRLAARLVLRLFGADPLEQKDFPWSGKIHAVTHYSACN